MLETWTTAIAVHNNQKAPWREQQYSSRVEVDICKIKDDLSEMEGTLGDLKKKKKTHVSGLGR